MNSLDRALVLAALGCSLTALFWPRSQPAVQPDLPPLRDELSIVRRSVPQEPTPMAAAPETVSPDGVTIRQVHEWVWGLEQRLVQLEQSLEQSRMPAGASPAPQPDITQARQVALSPQASIEERLAALRALRMDNARTSDVVRAMLQVQAGSKDPKVRADIFRQLSGVKDPILKPPLINALLKDEYPKVREEAAETLAPFLEDPYVRSALSAAAQNDADEKVRRQARETLERTRER